MWLRYRFSRIGVRLMKHQSFLLALICTYLGFTLVACGSSSERIASRRTTVVVDDDLNTSYSLVLPQEWTQSESNSPYFNTPSKAEISIVVQWQFRPLGDYESIDDVKAKLIDKRLAAASAPWIRKRRFSQAGFEGVLVENRRKRLEGAILSGETFSITAVKGHTVLMVSADRANSDTLTEVMSAIESIRPLSSYESSENLQSKTRMTKE